MRKLFFIVMVALHSTLIFASGGIPTLPTSTHAPRHAVIPQLISRPSNAPHKTAESKAASSTPASNQTYRPTHIFSSIAISTGSAKNNAYSILPAPSVQNNPLVNSSTKIASKDNHHFAATQINISALFTEPSGQSHGQVYTNNSASPQPSDEAMQEWDSRKKAAAIKNSRENNIDTISYRFKIQTGNLISHFIVEEIVQGDVILKEKLKKEIIFKHNLCAKIHKEAGRYAHEKGHLQALKNAAVKIEKEIATIQQQIAAIDADSIARCKEIKKMIVACAAAEKKSKNLTDTTFNAQAEEFKKIVAALTIAVEIQKLLNVHSANSRYKAIHKIVITGDASKPNQELLPINSCHAQHKKQNELDHFSDVTKKDFDDLISFFENIDCEEFIKNNGKLPPRILATSAAFVMSYPYLYSAAGPLAPFVGAALLTNLLFQNRETIFNFIHNLKEGNYCKTPEEKQALEQLQKYFQDLDTSFDKVIHIGYALDIEINDIFMKSLQYGYRDDKNAQVITILDKNFKQAVFVISSDPKIGIRQLTADDGISQYQIPQSAINAQKEANEIFEHQKIDAQKAQKQAEINTVLAKAEKNLPLVEKYNKLPCHDHLLPVDGAGRLFIPAYSKDGIILRDNKGAYYDDQGNKWTLDEVKQQWMVTNSFNSNKFIVYVQNQNPPIIDIPSDPINNDQDNSLTDTDEEVDNPHINQAKNNNTKKPKQNNKNNKPDDQDPKDPKDPKKPDDKYTYKNGKIDDYEKHHKNSPENIGKPPRDPQKALDDSFDVEGSDQRVSVQDKKIIIFKQSAPGLYHGYIIENYQLLEPFIKQALFAAGLIKNIKTGKLA